MIFDCPKMNTLREKYRDLENYEVPEIVLLDRFDDYEGERQHLENLITSVNLNKQSDWLGRLVNEEAQQHIGAWFEVMLYGWLSENFTVQVEPEVLGNQPDFVVDIGNNKLAVEARAFLITPEERMRRMKFNRMFSLLGSIERSFLIVLKVKQFGEKIDKINFIQRVTKWLDSSANQKFIYHDDFGNVLNLSATPKQNAKNVNVFRSEGFRVNSDALEAPLKEKAYQHKALRKAEFPYIIAIFIEPNELSAEEVNEAWIGKNIVLFDWDENKVIDEKLDQSGLHYYGNEIRYKSVTGTLVFKSNYDVSRKSRYLQCWYLQNPYASVPINPTIFPAESRFVVVKQDNKAFEMRWVT